MASLTGRTDFKWTTLYIGDYNNTLRAIPIDSLSAFGLKYDEQGRPYKSTRQGRLYFHADGPAMTDVWDLPFLSTVSLERTGWPTQKPLALLERIIRASSDPGDLVADFFCGSGTTLVAAQRLGRRYVGCDTSVEAVRIARGRLTIAKSKG